MQVTIEETLAASNVDTALTNAPYLIYSEVLEGARRPLAFLQVVEENFDLIGNTGDQIQFIKATHLSASSITEANMLASGMSSADKTLTAVSVAVTDVTYSAVQLSDILKEDFPKINWVQIHLRNMGKAVMEWLDAHVYTTLFGASGTATQTCVNLTYNAVTDGVAKLQNNNWIKDEGNPPFLIIAPESQADLVQDTSFTETRRYTTAEVARMVQGERGLYGGCRVLVTSYLDGKVTAFIVFPSNTANGPVIVLCWKRRLTVGNEREEKFGYTYFVTTCRAKALVTQADGICKITMSTTP